MRQKSLIEHLHRPLILTIAPATSPTLLPRDLHSICICICIPHSICTLWGKKVLLSTNTCPLYWPLLLRHRPPCDLDTCTVFVFQFVFVIVFVLIFVLVPLYHKHCLPHYTSNLKFVPPSLEYVKPEPYQRQIWALHSSATFIHPPPGPILVHGLTEAFLPGQPRGVEQSARVRDGVVTWGYAGYVWPHTPPYIPPTPTTTYPTPLTMDTFCSICYCPFEPRKAFICQIYRLFSDNES